MTLVEREKTKNEVARAVADALEIIAQDKKQTGTDPNDTAAKGLPQATIEKVKVGKGGKRKVGRSGGERKKETVKNALVYVCVRALFNGTM